MSSPAPARSARRATFGAAFGFFVDMFDVYLPTVALVPAMDYFTPPDMSADTRAIASAFIFVATLLGRPLGSAIFGWFADRVGRRRVTLWSVTGCAVCTALIAALPGYAALGPTSVALLIALRLLDGIFLGGEYTGATPLAMEIAPAKRRGLHGSIIGAGSALANCVIAAVTFVVLLFFPSGGAEAPYSQWGWRLPFVLGAVLCVVFLVYYSRAVDESQTWKSARKARNPVREVVLGRQRRVFVQVFVMMAGVWFTSNMASGLLPTALKQEAHLSATEVTAALIIAQGLHALVFPLIGLLSDRIGRRPTLVYNGVAVAFLCSGAFATLAAGWWSGFGAILLVTFLVRLAGGSVFAVTPSYLCERFPAATRGSGFGLGYSTPLLVTSFYAYYQNWLEQLIPREYTSTVLLVLGGALIAAGALLGPETRDEDLSATPSPSPESTPTGIA